MRVSFKFSCRPQELAIVLMTELIAGANTPFGSGRADSEETISKTYEDISAGKIPTYDHEIQVVWEAIFAWVNNTPVDYSWEYVDPNFDAYNNLRITDAEFYVGVAHSDVVIVKTPTSGEFLFSGDGTRHSFWNNHTGRIGERLIEMCTGNVTVETLSTNPVDKTADRLFRPTVQWETQHALKELGRNA